jgi:sec-independent protein translocase protein TatB
MFDIGISELGVIGVVALIVLGPEKLPRVARTVGNLMGRAQRYMADVKAEVNRQIELDELRDMKSAVETSVRDIHGAVSKNLGDVRDEFDSAWKEATTGLPGIGSAEAGSARSGELADAGPYLAEPGRPKRLKRNGGQSVPLWYRRHSRLRGHALSGAARMARYRVRTRA